MSSRCESPTPDGHLESYKIREGGVSSLPYNPGIKYLDPTRSVIPTSQPHDFRALLRFLQQGQQASDMSWVFLEVPLRTRFFAETPRVSTKRIRASRQFQQALGAKKITCFVLHPYAIRYPNNALMVPVLYPA